MARLTGARIRGLTPNVAHLELARNQAVATGVGDRVAFDRGSASELPYPDSCLDVVLAFESPCHFPDRGHFFREARRAEAVGVSEKSLRDWHAKLVPQPALCGENATVEQLQQENKRLRKQLKRAEMEREISRKATAYFAKESQ